MANQELITEIDNIINNAVKRIKFAYQYRKEACDNAKDRDSIKKIEHNISTLLVFPSYSENNELNGNTRISEQELRFAFVEAFNDSNYMKNNNYFYSIETPTRYKYSNFSSSTKEKPTFNEDGKSGEFDLVIFDKKLNNTISFKIEEGQK